MARSDMGSLNNNEEQVERQLKAISAEGKEYATEQDRLLTDLRPIG